jgi:hypothetical protein
MEGVLHHDSYIEMYSKTKYSYHVKELPYICLPERALQFKIESVGGIQNVPKISQEDLYRVGSTPFWYSLICQRRRLQCPLG